MKWTKHIKHIIPPSFYAVFTIWGSVSAFIEPIITFTTWIDEKYKTPIFIVMIVTLVLSLLICLFVSRFICILNCFKKEENLNGLNEQIDIKNEQIDDLKNSLNLNAFILNTLMMSISPKEREEFYKKIELVTEVNKIGNGETKNSKDNQ
ncbi:hypothetical protein [Ligilactobacillus acidipiscis]|uniref:hypothetical protein n=1 Tax=Ligilactobacillus acidipiscis TaxID=89059 RepID=UPI000705141B|nr:hypothetical protein [Ligilactobacillus acidipiscis]GAW63421.1 hypothetical protein Lacidipiscis_00604 [Ligilactobacillus acidipiscis]GEN19629.1 hypothetical protein LAC02_29100 [Ligilactobacillus acidipiscis]